MDRLADMLRRIRDPRECAELLLGASAEDTASVARQLAAVLFSLPAAHEELGGGGERGPAVGELVRRLGMLELLLLRMAGGKEAAQHGIPSAQAAGGGRAPGAGGTRTPFRAGGFSGGARSLVHDARRAVLG